MPRKLVLAFRYTLAYPLCQQQCFSLTTNFLFHPFSEIRLGNPAWKGFEIAPAPRFRVFYEEVQARVLRGLRKQVAAQVLDRQRSLKNLG